LYSITVEGRLATGTFPPESRGATPLAEPMEDARTGDPPSAVEMLELDTEEDEEDDPMSPIVLAFYGIESGTCRGTPDCYLVVWNKP